MERFSTCDLREKEIINLCDGTKLGCPSDFEFDSCDGKITAIIISRPCGFLGMGKGRDLIIPWHKIECIGEDAILVRISANEGYPLDTDRKKRRYW